MRSDVVDSGHCIIMRADCIVPGSNNPNDSKLKLSLVQNLGHVTGHQYVIKAGRSIACISQISLKIYTTILSCLQNVRNV